MKKMRIFHGLTEVAGQGSYSVLGLNTIGLDAEIAVWRDHPLQYSELRSLRIGWNRWLYPWYAVKMVVFALKTLFRYNVFHFHAYRSLLPFNLDLFCLKILRKRVFMEFHGSELRMKNIVDGSPIISRKLNVRLKRILRSVDAVILHDAELYQNIKGCSPPVFYVPLRLDLSRFTPNFPDPGEKSPLIVHAPSKPELKGTSHIVQAINNLAQKYDFRFQLVHGLKQDEAVRIYQEADIIIDQLLAGTYGVFAIEGMALGKPVVCYITDEMKAEFPEELPIISANHETIEKVIESLLLDGECRHEVGVRSRAYAEHYHNHTVIACVLEKIYRGEIVPVGQRAAFAFVKQLAPGCNKP